MFCPNCGANVPDGSPSCTTCGYQLTQNQQAPAYGQYQQPAYEQQYQQPAYQQQYQQPAYEQQYQQPAYEQQYQQPAYQQPQQNYYPRQTPAPISKKEFLKTKAPEDVKKKAGLVTITFLVSLALLIASAIAPLAVSIFDIPAMSMVITMADADPDELTDDMERSLDEAEYRYEMQKGAMSKKERDAAKKVLDSMEALCDNFSVMNLSALVNVTKSAGEDYLDSDDLNDLEEISGIMTVVIIALVSSFLLPLLFAVLGGLNKNTGLTIAALVFTFFAQVSLSGFLWVVLSAAVYIFQAVLCSNITKSYKAYRAGRLA